MHVYFDESGNTGSNLSSKLQPAYVLASHNMPELESQNLLNEMFGEKRRRELKFKNLSKAKNGPERIAELVRLLEEKGFKRRAYVADKMFLLSAKLFDVFVETGMHEAGLNAYENGYNVIAANVIHAGILTALGRDGLFEFHAGFESILRKRDIHAYDAFWKTFDTTVIPKAMEPLQKPLEVMSKYGQRVSTEDYLKLPTSVLSTGPSFLISELVSWTEFGERHITPIHDASTAIEAAQFVNEHFREPGVPRRWIGEKGGAGHWHPLPMDSVLLADSRDYASLQIADILAGAYSECSRASWGYKHRSDIVGALFDVGLDSVDNHMSFNPEWKSPWSDNPQGTSPIDFMTEFFVSKN